MAKHHGDASMSSAFIYSDDFRGYSFSPDHPFNQLRVTLTYDLLQKGGFISPSQIISPRMATDEESAYVHTEEYINAVTRAGEKKKEKSIDIWTRNRRYTDVPKYARSKRIARWWYVNSCRCCSFRKSKTRT